MEKLLDILFDLLLVLACFITVHACITHMHMSVNENRLKGKLYDYYINNSSRFSRYVLVYELPNGNYEDFIVTADEYYKALKDL